MAVRAGALHDGGIAPPKIQPSKAGGIMQVVTTKTAGKPSVKKPTSTKPVASTYQPPSHGYTFDNAVNAVKSGINWALQPGRLIPKAGSGTSNPMSNPTQMAATMMSKPKPAAKKPSSSSAAGKIPTKKPVSSSTGKIPAKPTTITKQNPNGYKQAPINDGTYVKPSAKPTETKPGNTSNPNGWKQAPIEDGTYVKPNKTTGGTATGTPSAGGTTLPTSYPSTGTPTPTGTPTTGTPTPATMNDWYQQANTYKAQIDAALKSGFQYDPSKDPSYQALETLAQKNAKVASKNAMEDMNDRGILNSTITSDRMGQIQQNAQDTVTAQIPTLQNQAYGKWMDHLNTLNSLWSSSMGQGNTDRNFAESQRQYNLGYNLDQNKFAYQQGQDAISNSQAADRINLGYQNYYLDQAKAIQSASGFKSDQETNKALGEIYQFKNSNEAWNYVNTKLPDYLKSGVDLNTITGAINKRWPPSKSSTSGSIGDKLGSKK